MSKLQMVTEGVEYNENEYEWAYNGTGSAVAAGAVYRLDPAPNDNAGGLEIVALADDTDTYKICVIDEPIANGARGRVLVKGVYLSATTPSLSPTAGHGFKVHNGALASTAASYADDDSNNLGYFVTAATSSTSNDLYLNGDRKTATT